MKQVSFSRFGLPQEVLEVNEVAIPEPGPGQFRVRITARPINPSDVLNVQGLYGTQPTLPALAGFEGVGTVDACGTGVPEYLVGQRVYVLTQGSWQEYVCVPAMSTIPIPPEISDDVACQLIVNPFSAWLMLDQLNLKEGQWLLSTAGASALGQMLVQMAKKRGIRTISTVRRDDAIAPLMARGADVVINTEREDLVQRVREITQGKGVPAALDAVGGAIGGKAVECLATGGTMLAYGLMSLEPIPLNSGLVIFKMLTIKGFWLTPWISSARPEARQKVVEGVIELLASGEVTPPIEARYTLDQVHEACIHAMTPGRMGKILLIG